MQIQSLDERIENVFRLQERQKRALKKMGVETLMDLLMYFPKRYAHLSEVGTLSGVRDGEDLSFYGTILSLKAKKTYRTKIPSTEAIIEDREGNRISVIWFHQAYLAKMLREGQTLRLSGKVNIRNGKLSMANPHIETHSTLPIDTHDTLFGKGEASEQIAYPIYAERRGITSRWIFHKILQILQSEAFQELEDYLPQHILQRYHLPSLRTALVWIHLPRKEEDAQAARKRFAFEEIFLIQLQNQRYRLQYRKKSAYPIPRKREREENFIARFPFEPTPDQTEAIDHIMSDLQKREPMLRLLEGDVGSGKTFVAAVVAHHVSQTHPLSPSGKIQGFGRLQVAYMAPTEVLAQQLFENFIRFFEGTGTQIGLITGTGAKKFPSKTPGETWTPISRNQLLTWVANGEIPILIGTHALIQKKVQFKNLALVIVDEQHRFGTRQRMALRQKEDHNPHYLSMSATPIPRTLALTLYGDLDLSVIETLPSGRKEVITKIVPNDEESREEVYEAIRKKIQEGRQAYVICPRIDEPDPDKEKALRVKSVKEEYARLQEKVFPEFRLGMLHSRMKKKEKEEVMSAFARGEIDILVSTSVVEVGVNVPNATSIIIEGAERFGLAQLHQLRGRVMRSEHQATCYLFAETKSEKSLQRLQHFLKAKNGFELAEADLQLRGAGDLAGTKQWGVSDLAMEAIRNMKMVEFARKEAQELIREDPTLENFPELEMRMKKKSAALHLE